METNKVPIASFTTNSFTRNPYLAIILSVFYSMALMFILILIGIPFMVVFVLFYASIFVFLGFSTGKVSFSLYEQGIEQKIRRFIPYYLNKTETIRFVTWNKIKSYKIDNDLSKGLRKYHYLKLYLNESPHEIWITDQRNKLGFEEFKNAFEVLMNPENTIEKIANSNNNANTNVDANIITNPPQFEISHKSNIPNIRKKKSFYDTLFAKIITLFFIIITILLIIVGIKFNMRLTNWVKMFIVIVPGTVYMTSRVFFRSKKDDLK